METIEYILSIWYTLWRILIKTMNREIQVSNSKRTASFDCCPSLLLENIDIGTFFADLAACSSRARDLFNL